MNARMATGTRLILRCLDVLRHSRCLSCGVWRREVTEQADRVHACTGQKLWIRTTMREMTGGATFGLDRCVLMDEWPGYRDMAFGTNHELPGSGGK